MRLFDMFPKDDRHLSRVALAAMLVATVATAITAVFVVHPIPEKFAVSVYRLGPPQPWAWVACASLVMVLTLRPRLLWLRWLLLVLLVPEATILLLFGLMLVLPALMFLTALYNHQFGNSIGALIYAAYLLVTIAALGWHVGLGVRCFGVAGLSASPIAALPSINPLSGSFNEDR